MGLEVKKLDASEKVAEALKRSLPHLPSDARAVVEAMLEPATLALIGGTLVAWAASHAFGVGEIVDGILLGVGILALGFSVFEGASALCAFTLGTIRAKTEADLDEAGRQFARAVVILGLSTVQALLLRGQGRAIIGRGRPRIYPMPAVGQPPAPGNMLRISRPHSIPGGTLGTTDAFGVIQVARNQTLTEQRITLLHELVHRFFSPRTGPLRRLRAELSMSAYARSALLRHVEEALAEGYAQLRVNGLSSALQAYRFPLTGGYVTVSQLVTEGQAVGTIVLGGVTLRVSMSLGSIPGDP